MNATDLKNSSETNWERIDQLTDEQIDTSDIPPLNDAFFAKAELRLPKGKVPVVISLDADVFQVTWLGIPELDQYGIADLCGRTQELILREGLSSD